ncbi:hypothetical protein [Chryseobacterium culicis]|uniref:Uncharacterized protein n=1 Tax=Chryseobacterium culicis TaxID=680127 RepID=A0A1H6H1I0_CHRCI|nr:hypothetical protein [Chryseobacterium culicis]SEH29667.1 hypothetical protein SAMN05421593_1139 [Chryseobacterium culicis]
MMNTKIFVISTMLVGISVFSQEIKIKKGELLLDDKVVAKVEDKNRVYRFSDMNDKFQFSAAIISPKTSGTQPDRGWIECIGANGNVKEIEFSDNVTFTLSVGKLLVQNIMARDLITKDGIDEAKVNEFFLTADRSLSEKRNESTASQKADAKNEDDLGLSIDFKDNIKNKNGEVIGSITRVIVDPSQSKFFGSPMVHKFLEYRVFDFNRVLIAKLPCTDSDINNEQVGLKIYTFDNKVIPMAAKNGWDYTKPLSVDDIADRLVKKLYANGYSLGDMRPVFEGIEQEKRDAVNQKNLKAENQAKANSINIYNTPGYVIDKTGTKKEGNITIEFESLDAKMGREKGMGDLTNYGGSVTLNVEGKNEFFKAKDGVKFCAGERCFIGVAGTDMFGSKFTEILSENNGSYVLVNLRTPNYYYLKLADQPKAAYLGENGDFGTRKPEKMKKIFDEYVNCPAMNFSNYDTTTKDGLIKILDDYQTSCKK